MAQQMWANIAAIVTAGYRSNAFAPLVWFVAIAVPLLITGMCFTNDVIIKYIFVGVIVFIIVVCIIMYVVLFIKDPKLLQSERFRIEDKKLDLVASKGGEILIQPYDLTAPPKQIEGGANE